MKFLPPTASPVPADFVGIFTTPSHLAVPKTIQAGMPWAGDNEAFTKGWDNGRYFHWLKTMEPYKDNCLFLSVPDIVANAKSTSLMWYEWASHFESWPVALVAQDGATADELGVWGCFDDPDDDTEMYLTEPEYWDTFSKSRGFIPWRDFDCLFIGGSLNWKLSDAAIDCIKPAQKAGKHIHIGRVNHWKRYKQFAMIRGSEHFTCDGTRPRHDGLENSLKAWAAYQKRTVLQIY